MVFTRALPYSYLILLYLLAASCGLKAGGGVPNDPTPTGTVVGSGAFASSASGVVAQGTATVYLESSGQYALALSGLDLPAESGMQVYANGSTFIANLESPDGTQNYYTSAVSTWSTVSIYSTSHATTYLQATIQ